MNSYELFAVSTLLYLSIFVIPVILYLKFHDKKNPIKFLKLNNSFKNILKGLLISAIFILSLIIKNMIFGFGAISFDIGFLWVSGLLVGVFEEIPFRGFLLQKLLMRMNFISANIFTTVAFVLVHIPIWMINDVNILGAIKSVFLVSLVLGYLFKEYKSLWIPITCHTVFNLCIWIGLG